MFAGLTLMKFLCVKEDKNSIKKNEEMRSEITSNQVMVGDQKEKE